VLTRIVQGPPERPNDKASLSRLTDEWWNICNLCWEQEPSKRSSISGISRELEIFFVLFAFRNIVQPSDPYFVQGATANNRVGVRGYILELATGGETSLVLPLSIRLPLNSCRFPTLGAMASDKLHTLQDTHNIP